MKNLLGLDQPCLPFFTHIQRASDSDSWLLVNFTNYLLFHPMFLLRAFFF